MVVKLNHMAGGRGNAPLKLSFNSWRLQSQRQRRQSLDAAQATGLAAVGHSRRDAALLMQQLMAVR